MAIYSVNNSDFSSCWKQKARAKFQMFRASCIVCNLRKLRRLAQCSGSETLKMFLFGSFFFAPKKNELQIEIWLSHVIFLFMRQPYFLHIIFQNRIFPVKFYQKPVSIVLSLVQSRYCHYH